MKLRHPDSLQLAMLQKNMSQAELARRADCTRQFISALVKGRKTTCSPATGLLIEEALGQSGKLFDRRESPSEGQAVASKVAA